MTDVQENPIRAALEGWDEDHWVKRTLHQWLDNGEESYCALGRMMVTLEPAHFQHYGGTSPNIVIWGAAVTSLAGVADELFPGRAEEAVNLFGWTGLRVISSESRVALINNHPATTFEDMEAWFEKGAQRWDEEFALV